MNNEMQMFASTITNTPWFLANGRNILKQYFTTFVHLESQLSKYKPNIFASP
jgi:hypothetical protein